MRPRDVGRGPPPPPPPQNGTHVNQLGVLFLRLVPGVLSADGWANRGRAAAWRQGRERLFVCDVQPGRLRVGSLFQWRVGGASWAVDRRRRRCVLCAANQQGMCKSGKQHASAQAGRIAERTATFIWCGVLASACDAPVVHTCRCLRTFGAPQRGTTAGFCGSASFTSDDDVTNARRVAWKPILFFWSSMSLENFSCAGLSFSEVLQSFIHTFVRSQWWGNATNSSAKFGRSRVLPNDQQLLACTAHTRTNALQNNNARNVT